MSHTYAIASVFRRYFKPVKDATYLAFIRKFPCVACGATRWIEAAHTGPRGLGQKADDSAALPICANCHRLGPKALHKIGPEDFQLRHDIDFASLIVMFNGFYEGKRRRAA